jgi:hypothetical protein
MELKTKQSKLLLFWGGLRQMHVTSIKQNNGPPWVLELLDNRTPQALLIPPPKIQKGRQSSGVRGAAPESIAGLFVFLRRPVAGCGCGATSKNKNSRSSVIDTKALPNGQAISSSSP